MDSVLGVVIENAARNQEHNESDFLGEDGFLYCGICKTRKQTIIYPPGMEPTKVPVVCKCERERMKQEKAKAEYEKRMDQIKRLRKASLMDSKFREATFDNFKQTEANAKNLKLCKRYATHFDQMLEKNLGLLFYGNSGTGKSFAAACIANYLLDQNIPVVMTSFVKLVEVIQKGGERADNIIACMNNAQLVILDDLGAERSTSYALEKVYDIIDSRYRQKLPMILTTNLTRDEMKEETDIRFVRVYDRIFEVCFLMQFVGDSWRRKKAYDRYLEMKKFLVDD